MGNLLIDKDTWVHVNGKRIEKSYSCRMEVTTGEVKVIVSARFTKELHKEVVQITGETVDLKYTNVIEGRALCIGYQVESNYNEVTEIEVYFTILNSANVCQ